VKRIQLLQSGPIFRPFVLQKHILQSIYRSVTPPLFSYNFLSVFPIPRYVSFNSLSVGKDKNQAIPVEMCARFREFSVSLTNGDISLFTDGSRRDEEDENSAVGAAVYSLNLALALKHKLPAETSIFSAEAWAIYQTLILESTSYKAIAVFSDSRSVLNALSSFSFKSCVNYLIPLIQDKYHTLSDRGFFINFAWIPSHSGIMGNERIDSFAKQAALRSETEI